MSRSCCNGSDLNSANANDLSSDPTPFLNPNDRKQAKTNKGNSLREVGMSRPFGIDIEHPCSLNVSAASTHDTTRPGKFQLINNLLHDLFLLRNQKLHKLHFA